MSITDAELEAVRARVYREDRVLFFGKDCNRVVYSGTAPSVDEMDLMRCVAEIQRYREVIREMHEEAEELRHEAQAQQDGAAHEEARLCMERGKIFEMGRESALAGLRERLGI